ncbi:outer membrane protein [Pseudahrensia aquimaris]|uniref:Outer membrane protein n=1 Tax=Pseudahrensia aquimaris TaxID=744461 RepID=A0ABW3FL58_9HYPH
MKTTFAKTSPIKSIFAALAMSGVSIPLAFAADAVIEQDPTPPPPAVVEDAALYGYYVAARLGFALPDDTSFGLDTAADVPTGVSTAYEDWNLSGAVAAGMEFGNGFRGELELGYSSFDVESHRLTALDTRFGGSDAFGDATAITGLVNGYYDFDLGTFKPYVGAGIGMAQLDFDNYGINLAAPTAGLPAGPVTAIDDSGYGFAWQVGLGTSVAVTETIDFEIGYRYSGIENVELTAVDGTDTDVSLDSHSVMSGLRFKF